MSKTKKWIVSLVNTIDGAYIYVGTKAHVDAIDQITFRSIQPSAAARSYIKNNLKRKLHLMDDGGNEGEDLRVGSEAWHRNKRGFNGQNKWLVGRNMQYTEAGKIKVVIDKE